MNDYGKVTQFLARTGRTLPAPAKRPVDELTSLGFDEVDDNRWCATVCPTPTTFGWCVIVSLEDGAFKLGLTVDTEENEQTSPWVYPSARFTTALEAARAGLGMVKSLTEVR